MKNVMQLKALVKNYARKYGLNEPVTMQVYMLQRLLVRIVASEYRDDLVVKGGFLMGALAGFEARSTKDLDTTAWHTAVNEESVRLMFTEICGVDGGDGITFKVEGIKTITEQRRYHGVKVNLVAVYEGMRVPLSVDVTAGDPITPNPVKRVFPLMLEGEVVEAWSYPTETVLAEKLETVLSRGTATSRAKDFYDLYVIASIPDSYDARQLKEALRNTTEARGTSPVMDDAAATLRQIEQSNNLRKTWRSFQESNHYAAGITFEDCCRVLGDFVEELL